jgi:hypothetical protein
MDKSSLVPRGKKRGVHVTSGILKLIGGLLSSQSDLSRLGCPSKLVSIRNNRNWNPSWFRHYLKQNVCFSCFASIPKTESFDVSIEPKQTEDPPKQFKREYIWVFFRKFRVARFVLVCYETVPFVSVVSV